MRLNLAQKDSFKFRDTPLSNFKSLQDLKLAALRANFARPRSGQAKFGVILISLVVSFLLYAIRYTLYANPAAASNYVRVAIIQDVASSVRLKINGSYEIIDSVSNKSLYRGNNLNTTVTVYNGGIFLGKIGAATDKLMVIKDDLEPMAVNGRNFLGRIQFIKNNQEKLTVINHVELEDYIKGILYHEASHFWPMDALMAQAIVCRTYAIYQKQENKLKDYDLTSDTYSQVYGGRTSQRYRTDKAVEQTAGLVLKYKGEVLPAYYHATCAGYTEDALLLWNIDTPPLKGVACSFCKDSPHYNWHYVLSLKELKSKLSQAGFIITGEVKDIVISGVDRSGRIGGLKIVSADKEKSILAKDFRNIIGPNIIRSTKFSVNIAGDDVVFEGFGWGHGVGLCQWGAYFMSKKGYKYYEILKYYYPGCEITQLN